MSPSRFGGVLPSLQATGVPAGFVAFVASSIQDVGGNKLVMGTVEVLPTDSNDKPISAAAGGPGQPGQMSEYAPAIFAVTNGVLPSGAVIADTNQTLPPNICYRITIKDPTGYPLSVLRRVQTTLNTTFNLDTYQPVVPTQTQVQLVAGVATALAPGSSPTVAIAPNSSGVPVIAFGIPSGAPGAIGPAGPAGSVAALSDGVTGVSQSIVVNYGILAVIPTSLLAAGVPFAYVFADQGAAGVNWAMRIVNGERGWLNIGSAGASPIPFLCLIDLTTGLHWTVSIVNGEEVFTQVSSSVAGALQALLADSMNGAHFALTFNSGEFGFAPHS